MPFKTKLLFATSYIEGAAHAGNTVAKLTLKILNDNEVELLPFSETDKASFESLMDEARREQHETPEHLSYPPTQEMIDWIESSFMGYIVDNKIYLRSTLTPAEMAEVIVHEVNHYINNSGGVDYTDTAAALREELRADVAIELYKGTPLTPALVYTLACNLARQYHRPPPGYRYPPEGYYDDRVTLKRPR